MNESAILAAAKSGMVCALLLLGGPRAAAQAVEAAPLPRAREKGASEKTTLDLGKFTLEILHLKAARTALAAEREAAGRKIGETSQSSAERAALQMRLAELLTKLSRTAPAPPSPPAPSPSPQPIPGSGVTEVRPRLKEAPAAVSVPARPIDPLGLATALYQAGDYAGALTAFRAIDLTGLRAEERLPVQYLIATCLRKSGKQDEAATLYREVANSRADPFLAECAQWQLASLRWQRDLDSRITSLRQRRQAEEKQP